MTLNLKGYTFGRITVLEKTVGRIGSSIVWRCSCRCGNPSVLISARDLKSKLRRGCGACADTKHPLYSTWRGIIARCESPNTPEYKHYGGRGITICAEW